jgi:hypothetical protein
VSMTIRFPVEAAPCRINENPTDGVAAPRIDQ